MLRSLVCLFVWLVAISAALAQQPNRPVVAAPARQNPPAIPAAKPAPAPVVAACRGSLFIGDQTIKIEQVAVYETSALDRQGYAVLASSRPIPLDSLKAALVKGRGSDDSFAFFEPNVKVNFDSSGNVLWCNAWANNHSVSVSGSKSLTGTLAVADGRGKDTVELKPEGDNAKKFGFKFEFDQAIVKVTLPAAPGSAVAGGGQKPPVAAGTKPSVKDLPMPKDAAKVEYKKIVGQLGYESDLDVKAMAKFLTGELAKKGWVTPDDDLVTAKSAILRRTLGKAGLTIFIKPMAAGCTVSIMSEGLAWDDDPADGAADDDAGR